MVKDPVCGMQVEEKKAKATAVHEGHTYAFCSPSCKQTFEKTPEKFVEKKAGGHTGCCSA
jgi:YHS domain-containing protein